MSFTDLNKNFSKNFKSYSLEDFKLFLISQSNIFENISFDFKILYLFVNKYKYLWREYRKDIIEFIFSLIKKSEIDNLLNILNGYYMLKDKEPIFKEKYKFINYLYFSLKTNTRYKILVNILMQKERKVSFYVMEIINKQKYYSDNIKIYSFDIKTNNTIFIKN